MADRDIEPAGPRKGRLPLTVVALGVTSLFTDVSSEMVFPLLPAFLAGLGATPAFLGLVEGLADATASLLKLVSGLVADRVARKKRMVLLGYGVASAIRPLLAIVTAPWQVLAIRVADRLGKGIRGSPRDVLIAASVPRTETGRAFGFHSAMDHAGAVFGPLLATLLLGLGWPLRRLFLFTAVPGLLSVLSVLLVREKDGPPAVREGPASAQSGPLPRAFWRYTVTLTVFSLGNSSDAFLILRAGEAGVPTRALPLLWSAFHVAKLVSAYLGGGWSDRTPRTRLIVAGWMVYAMTYLGFGFAREPWHAWALFLVYGCYYGLTEPAEKALVKDLAPPELRGRAYGIYNFVVGISAVPAGLLTGGLWAAFGPFPALTTGAALAAVAACALLGWARPEPAAADHP